jgi:hypothetical protein
MENKEWFEEIKFCLNPHPELYPEAGDIYIPKDTYKITFLFQGMPSIQLAGNDVEISFNSNKFLVLYKAGSSYRILWQSLSGIELSKIPKEHIRKAKFYVVPNKKT